MRKLFLASVTCLALVLVSCSEKEITPEKYPYSSLTPEQQKEKLADEANSFLSQIQELNKEKGFEVFKAFSNFVRIEEPVVGGNRLRAAEDIITINSFYGKFTWQASTQTWKEEPADHLEFNFPVGDSTGKIVITGVSSGKNYTYEEYYEYYDPKTGQYEEEIEAIITVELPKELSAKFYLGESEVGGIQVNADIVDAESMPKSLAVSYSFGSYIYKQSYERSTGKVTASFKKGDMVLIDIKANLKGNLLDEDNIVLGNFTARIMDNLVFSGSVDFDKYGKEMDKLDARCYPDSHPDNFDWDKANEDYAKGSADLFNKYYNVFLYSTKEKTKIAKLTQKAVSKTYTYQWYDTIYTETYWTTVDMLRFNDSTEVEVEVYFSEGFELVLENFKKLIQ